MVLLDALGRRWALRVLWELHAGDHTFRVLREACGDVSPSVLADPAEHRAAAIAHWLALIEG